MLVRSRPAPRARAGSPRVVPVVTGVVFPAVAVVLALNLLLCLVRVVKGPGSRDRLLGVFLSGTTGVGLMLVLSVAMELAALRDVGLIMTALSAVVAIALLRAEEQVRAEDEPC